MDTLDLSVKGNITRLEKMPLDQLKALFDECSINDFLKRGMTPFHHKDNYVVTMEAADTYSNRHIFVIKNGVASEYEEYDASEIEDDVARKDGSNLILDLFTMIPRLKNCTAEELNFVILPHNSKQKYFAVLNGDVDPTYLPIIDSDIEHITISFECLQRFYDKSRKAVIERLVNKEIEIIDYVNDQTMDLTKQEKAILKTWDKKKQPFPLIPKAGFTLVNNAWHRAATVLLYDKKNKFTILIGQDEGTYFGVELADNPKSVGAAYTSLMPKEVKNKKGVLRQGEWFALPVAEKDIPADEDIVFTVEDVGHLPRKSDDSAKHLVEASDNGRIVIDKKGRVFALNATLVHENGDHKDLIWKGWVRFYENTAVRAYSVEGVD